MRPARLLVRISRGDISNVSFSDLVHLIEALGFREIGVRGSHYVFAHLAVSELVNLQAVHGQAKRYQIRQIVELIRRYDLAIEEDS